LAGTLTGRRNHTSLSITLADVQPSLPAPLLDNRQKSSSFGLNLYHMQPQAIEYGFRLAVIRPQVFSCWIWYSSTFSQPSTIRVGPLINSAIRRGGKRIDLQPNPTFIIYRSEIYVNLGSNSRPLEINTRTLAGQRRGVKEEDEGNEVKSDRSLHNT